MFIDESQYDHPQVRGSCTTAIERAKEAGNYGFRLPSALDVTGRWTLRSLSAINKVTLGMLSATPADFELISRSPQVPYSRIRPTGLLIQLLDVRPIAHRIDVI